MKMVESLPESPKSIRDVGLLADALYTLEVLESRYGVPFVFEQIQQPMIGGTCHPVPKDPLPDKPSGVHVLGRYDKVYLAQKIEELREEYKH